MITIVDPSKYYECLSCGREIPELLRTFKIGREERNRTEITLCTECLSNLIQQEILYQPKEK